MNRSRKLATLLGGVFFALPAALQAQSWNELWSDEFNGKGAVDSANWRYDVGPCCDGNPELQYYQSGTANVSQADGVLTIQARRETVGGLPFTSGRILTQGLRSFGPGDDSPKKIEARIAGPIGKGLWPAFWLLGENISSVQWPGCGEIDIMEHINAIQNTYGNIHWGDQAMPPNHLFYQAAAPVMTNFDGYHTYGITWDARAIAWYLDSMKVGEADITNDVNNTGAFHNPFFLLLNLAVGGNAVGNPDDNTPFPANMKVDYVRYSQYAMPTPVPAPTAVPAAPASPSGCAGFMTNVVNSGPTTAMPWFKLCTASYVAMRYYIAGRMPQSVYMTYNNNTTWWEHTVVDMLPGDVLHYQFTYNTGTSTDTAWYTWTHP